MELNSGINHEREQLRQFITTYRNLPILWDTKCPNYSKKDKRRKGYLKLLGVFRAIKAEATLMDVKKKINSMRSNFRKELKKVEESAAIGIQYRPSSWMYDELIFLNDSEATYPRTNSLYSETTTSTVIVSDEEDSGNDNDVSHSGENDMPISYHHQYSVKKPKYCESNQDDIPNTFTQFSDKRPAKNSSDSNQDDIPTTNTHFSDKKTAKSSSGSSHCDGPPRNAVNSHTSYSDDLAKVWAAKLKHLVPLQRLFAEKAINDVLFEAQLGTLDRNSVRINISDKTNTVSNTSDQIRISEPRQLSPEYKFSQTYGFTEDDHK